MPTENLEEKAPVKKNKGGRPPIYKTPEEKAAAVKARTQRHNEKLKRQRAEAREKGLVHLGAVQKELDRGEFEKLCEIQCTKEEIAAFFGVDESTLSDWCERTYGYKFSEVFAEKRKAGFASLRRTQWEWAQKQAVMAIFLGKNILGQSDTPENQADAETLKRAREILGGVESAIE